MRMLLIVLAALLASSSHAQASKDPKLKNTEFIHRYVGTYNYDGLLKEASVQKQLKLLLGEEFPHFIENMSAVRYPIDLIGLSLSASGARNDLPARETAVICVETQNMKVHAGIFSDSAMTIYTSEKNYGYLPSCLTQWVYFSIERGDNPKGPPAQGGSEFTFTHRVVSRAR